MSTNPQIPDRREAPQRQRPSRTALDHPWSPLAVDRSEDHPWSQLGVDRSEDYPWLPLAADRPVNNPSPALPVDLPVNNPRPALPVGHPVDNLSPALPVDPPVDNPAPQLPGSATLPVRGPTPGVSGASQRGRGEAPTPEMGRVPASRVLRGSQPEVVRPTPKVVRGPRPEVVRGPQPEGVRGSEHRGVRGSERDGVHGFEPESVWGPTREGVRGAERSRTLRRLTQAVLIARAWLTSRSARRVLVVVVVLAATLSPHGGSAPATAATTGFVAQPGVPTAARAHLGTGPGVAFSGAGAGSTGTGAVAQVAPASLGAQPAVAPVKQAPVAPPQVKAKAVILADEATGQVLYERNAGAARAMASTTKVMTALLTLERLDERKVVVIGSGPPKVGEESLRLRPGERLTVQQLLLGLMLKSANDAGAALAEAVDGSEAAFVRRMNRKAAALRLRATHYVTPYGLDRPGHQTSVRDLARLWEVAMRRADFRALVATKSARLPGGPLSLRRFVTTNQLLGPYRWTVGGKTGFTNRAGRCLVASASRGGRRLVAVALGSPNAFPDVQALFEYGFSKFVRVRLAQRGQPVSVAPGRPAAFRADADADALVRLDQLDKVRLALPEGAAIGATPAWFTGGGQRLVRVRLAPLPAGGAGTASTLVPAPTPSRVAPSATGAGPAAGTGGPLGTTLTADASVKPWPVPPGAPAPAIDPFLRRDPS